METAQDFKVCRKKYPRRLIESLVCFKIYSLSEFEGLITMSSVFSLYLFLPTTKMLSLMSFFVALLNERRIGAHVLLLNLNVFQAAHGSS